MPEKKYSYAIRIHISHGNIEYSYRKNSYPMRIHISYGKNLTRSRASPARSTASSSDHSPPVA